MPDRDRVVKETAADIAQLRAQHHHGRSDVQRSLRRLRNAVARPWFPAAVLLAFVAWGGFHAFAVLSGSRRSGLDPAWLQVALGFAAFLMTALILAVQRDDETLAEQREEFTLHLIAILDRKISAVTETMERVPATLSEPVNVERALDVLDDAHRRSTGESLRDERL